MANIANNPIPKEASNSFACLNCKLIKSKEQFVDNGCENCRILNKDTDAHDDGVRITKKFEGVAFHCQVREDNYVMSMTNPNVRMPGFYAINLFEKIDDHYEDYGNMSDEEFDSEEEGIY